MPAAPPSLEAIRFRPPQRAAAGIEVMSLATLRSRVSARHLAAAQRVEFFLLLWLEGGELRHEVDFASLPLRAGQLVFVRPGQAQRWHLHDNARGTVLLIDPPALRPLPGPGGEADALLAAMADWPACVTLDGRFADEWQADLARLTRDLATLDDSPADLTWIRATLLVLLLRLARWHRQHGAAAPPLPGGLQAVVRRFRDDLERHYHARRGVADVARRLGCSTSTLNRACLAATGQTAKVLLDRRLALEAARRLVHSQAGVASIGHALGFTEATNFTRFFVRLVGTTPLAFRQRHEAGAAPDAAGRAPGPPPQPGQSPA